MFNCKMSTKSKEITANNSNDVIQNLLQLKEGQNLKHGANTEIGSCTQLDPINFN